MMGSAKRVLTDNGLNIVSGAVGVTGPWEPNPNFSKNLDGFKNRCEQFAELGRRWSILRAPPQPNSRWTTM